MSSILQKFNDYGKMVKFSHTLFALPFALLSFVLSFIDTTLTKNQLLINLFLILVCMVSARNAAMGFNRLVDADIDAKNERTKLREIPSGVLSKKSVLGFTIFFSLIFVVATYFINFKCFLLSFPTLVIVLGYSYTKRFTWLCHYILGFGIGIAPTGAWISMKNEFDLIPVLWSFGLMFHIAGFDILYSTQDTTFDKSSGLYSIPSRFGVSNALLIARISHIVAFLLLSLAGVEARLGIIYAVFLICVGILFIVEHNLVNPKDLSKVPIAFFHINASISSILLLGVVVDKWNEIYQTIGRVFI
ncbi:MAG: UbiA-like polyprenyltransferase [Leptospiraceae bacterium]|nr:UbiA-like polyprenyltransferase [Leptospiraceae bacterium]